MKKLTVKLFYTIGIIGLITLNAKAQITSHKTSKEKEYFDLVLISDKVKEIDKIEQAILNGVELMFFNANTESPKQIINRIVDKVQQHKRKLNSLAIITHGEKGKFWLGNQEINSDNIHLFAADFYHLHANMKQYGNIFIYSCLSGAGEKGKLLVKKLSKFTVCNIFASNDITGKNGDWDLEVSSGVNVYKAILNTEKLALEFNSDLQTVLLPGYNLSIYVSGLPSQPSNITIDPVSRTIYYSDYNDMNGILRKVDSLGTINTITTDFTPGFDFYPYVATDIHYANGKVYCPLSAGELVEIDVVTGVSSIIYTFTGVNYEAGIDIKDDSLIYVTDGQGTSNTIWEYNLNTGIESAKITGIPSDAYGLEYDAAADTFYFAENVINFYKADVQSGTFNVISNSSSGVGNFAIDPDSKYLYARVGTEIIRVNISNGTSITFITGLTGLGDYQDLAFGPSSSGTGLSLYIADDINILECDGFKGIYVNITVNDENICLGDSATLNVLVNDTTGNLIPPFSYLWVPSSGLSCDTCQSTIANPSSTTTYTVYVTDSAGTQDSAEATVTVFSALPIANAGTDTTICEKESVQLNATGGTFYSWSPVIALSDPNIANPLANPVITTNYEVTATNACGSDVDTVTVFVNPLPTADAGVDTSVCTSDSIQLNATGGISYLWISGTGLSNITISNPFASPLATTTYTVEVTDGNGCVNTDSITISVGGGPVIASSARDSICASDTTQLFAYSCAPTLFYDGFEDGTYNQWTNAGGGYTITPTTSTAAVGNYSLQLSGGNFALYDGVYTTFVPSTPDYIGFHVRSSSTINIDAIVVIGDNNIQNNDGIIFFYADDLGFLYMNGITNPYNANQWYDIECKNVDFINKTFDYYIDGILIQSNILFNDTSAEVSQIHLFNFYTGSTAYYDDIIIGAPCSGIDTTLSYTWTPSAGLSNPNIADPVASPTTTTTYIVAASGGGCSATDTVTIYTISLDVVANASTSLICSGDTAQLNATANINGTTFSWSPAAGLSCTNCPDPIASPASNTMYTVTGTSGPCIDVDSVLITVGTGPIASSCTPITTSYLCCYGIYNVTFNTINNITADGIEGYQDYSCTNATNVIVDLTYPISLETNSSSNESVRVWIDYNNDGVFDNDSTTELVFWSDDVLKNHSGNVTIPSSAVINTPLRMRVGSDVWWNYPEPCINATRGQFEDYTVIVLPNTIPPVADFDITVLDMCQGIVSFTDQSLYNPTSWLWDFGDTSGLSTFQNPFYTYDIPGTYIVTLIVTNPWGSDTLTQQIVVSSLTANFTVSSNTVGIGEVVSFYDNSIGAVTWDWDFGDFFSSNLQNTFHSYSSAGTYTVTITVSNASGCIAQMALQIMVCANIPQTGAIIGPINVSVSDTANYSVLFNSGSIYNWTVIGGNQISGVQNFITVQWTTLSGIGQLFVVETDSLGCSGDTISLIINIGGVGINQYSIINNQLKIYPNPSRGVFTISMNYGFNTNLRIAVYDVLGQVAWSVDNRSLGTGVNEIEIDMRTHPAGIYHLQITTDRGTAHRKIVIE